MTAKLSLRGISKAYAAPVLQDINLEIRPGEVHALMGANGAGKSTLCNIIAGLVSADSGNMQYQGINYHPLSSSDAEACGVQIMMQELNLVEELTIAENVHLGNMPSRYGIIDYARINRVTQEILQGLGLGELKANTKIAGLGIGHKQLVELARVLSRSCNILVLDEPTAALSANQVSTLFAHIEKLKRKGVAIIYVSHRMDEIEQIADHISVLKDGELAMSAPAKEVSQQQLIRAMTGTSLAENSRSARRQQGKLALRLRGLSSSDIVQDIDLDIYHGEILGISGLMGSGRSELLRAIYGADQPSAGTVEFKDAGNTKLKLTPQLSVKNGMGFVPEDRKQQGLLLDQSIRLNASLACLQNYANDIGLVQAARENADIDASIQQLSLSCSGREQTTRQLSGGNQQKVILARWLLSDVDILLLDEPTRGIDIQARTQIYDLLDKLARSGKAIVIVSSDDSELQLLCDRIVVLSNGRLAKSFDYGQWSNETLLEAAFRFYSDSHAA